MSTVQAPTAAECYARAEAFIKQNPRLSRRLVRPVRAGGRAQRKARLRKKKEDARVRGFLMMVEAAIALAPPPPI